MIPTDFIEKKKIGLEHSPEEIKEFIMSYVRGDFPDYQMAAWLMAVNFQGMTDAETIALVDTMINSGETVDLSSIPRFKVDKHSTGEIVPADRKMYALRDVTSTVKSIPLICGSILSKKIVEGIDGLVLDVKTGNGAFLKEYNQSYKLAKKLKNVGEHFGLKVRAVITDMNQPLGCAVGNWLEVEESIQVLKGVGPEDVKEVSIYLTAWMMILSGIEKNFNKAKEMAAKNLESGEAYNKFIEMVDSQGGDVSVIEHPEKYKSARYIKPVISKKTGFVKSIDSYSIGMTTVALGAGRQNLKDVIKPEVGIVIDKKIGDTVESGEPLGVIHARDKESWKKAKEALIKAYVISKGKVSPPPLFYETF